MKSPLGAWRMLVGRQEGSVVVKTFFRSRNQERDLGLQVSRPRPRPGQNELECTRVSRSWSRDHNTAGRASGLQKFPPQQFTFSQLWDCWKRIWDTFWGWDRTWPGAAPEKNGCSNRSRKQWLQLWVDCDSTDVRLTFDCSSTVLRLFYVTATCSGLLHCGLNK